MKVASPYVKLHSKPFSVSTFGIMVPYDSSVFLITLVQERSLDIRRPPVIGFS